MSFWTIFGLQISGGCFALAGWNLSDQPRLAFGFFAVGVLISVVLA